MFSIIIMCTFAEVMNLKKNIFAIMVAAFMPMSMSAQTANTLQKDTKTTISEVVATAKDKAQVSGEAIIKTAMRYIGVPYRIGTSSPKSFDCSGFTSYVYKNHGISLLRASRDQYTQGEKVAKSDLRIGDLVFFTGRSKNGTVGHVGIVTEVDKDKNSFKFVHARTRGVGVDDSKTAYYSSRYVGARRVLPAEETAAQEDAVVTTTKEQTSPKMEYNTYVMGQQSREILSKVKL